nr:hypothetical protein [Nakamurella leprariae]
MLLLVGTPDLDEPQHHTGPGRQATPLLPRRLDGVHRIDDDRTPQRELLGRDGLDNRIRGQTGRLVPGDPGAPGRRLDGIH